MAGEEGVLPWPYYVREDGLDEMGKDGRHGGHSRVHEACAYSSRHWQPGGHVGVPSANHTPNAHVQWPTLPLWTPWSGHFPRSQVIRGPPILSSSGLLKSQTGTWSSPEGTSCMKVKLPRPFEPPLICTRRVVEAHSQDAKPQAAAWVTSTAQG